MSKGKGAKTSADDKELSGGTGSPSVDATNVDVGGTRSRSGHCWKMKGGTLLKEGPWKDPPR